MDNTQQLIPACAMWGMLWHWLYREYKASRAIATIATSWRDSHHPHLASRVQTALLQAPLGAAASLGDPPLFSAKSASSFLLHLGHLHTGERITLSVTCKCNNAFDTEKKKKEFMNKFSLKCDPTVCFLNSSMHFLGSFSLPPTQLHLWVTMTEKTCKMVVCLLVFPFSYYYCRQSAEISVPAEGDLCALISKFTMCTVLDKFLIFVACNIAGSLLHHLISDVSSMLWLCWSPRAKRVRQSCSCHPHARPLKVEVRHQIQ